MFRFIITPIAGTVGAIFFSHVDILLRGEERARKSILGGDPTMSLESMVKVDSGDAVEKFEEDLTA